MGIRVGAAAIAIVACGTILQSGGALAQAPLPKDVASFLDRRASCEHWAGEDAYDAARGRDIKAALKASRCDALEADEATLRKRHAGEAAILKQLDESAGDGD